MPIHETAVTDVQVNGKDAEQVLKDLSTEAQKYRKAMVEAAKANDLEAYKKNEAALKQNEKAYRQVAKAAFDVNTVLKNLSGSTLKDLQRAKAAITAEMAKMTRGTKEYIAASKNLQSVNKEIGKVKTEMTGAAGAQSNLWGKMGSTFAKFSGYVAAAYGVIKSGEFIIKSSQKLSDKWQETLGGVKSGIDAIARSIANWKFASFFSNLDKAIEKGQEIKRLEDDLQDRKRAQTVLEGKYRLEIAKQRDIEADKTKTDKERKDALNQAIRLEYELNQLRVENAEKDKQIRLEDLMLQSKLSKEQLENFFENFNNNEVLRNQAVKYLEIKKKFDELPGVTQAEKERANASTNYIGQMREQLAQTPEDVKLYAQILTAYGESGDEAIDQFIQSWRNVLDTQTEVFNETRRMKKEATGFEKKENVDNNKKVDPLKILEEEHQKRRLSVMQDYEHQLIDKEKFDERMLNEDMAYLYSKLAIVSKLGESTYDVEQQIAQKGIDLLEKTTHEKKKREEEIFEFARKLKQESLDDEDKLHQESIERRKQEQEQYRQLTQQLAGQMGETIGVFIAGNEEAQKNASKTLLLMMLDALEQIVSIAVQKIVWESMSSPDSIATFGATGVARVAAITALTKVAFGIIKGIVSSQHFSGTLDAVGAEDGRTYHAPYIGAINTPTYVPGTSLISERGGEIVVDANRSRNIRMRYPALMEALRAVPQHASGTLGAAGGSVVNNYTSTDPQLLLAIKQNSAVNAALYAQISKGINAKWSYDNYKSGLDKAEEAIGDVTR